MDFVIVLQGQTSAVPCFLSLFTYLCWLPPPLFKTAVCSACVLMLLPTLT